jgi:hypothetical protein
MKLKLKSKKRSSSLQPQLFLDPPDLAEESSDETAIFEPGMGESEQDLSTSGFSQAVTWATDWTAETIMLQLQRGIIDLDPDFQRRDAWRPHRKSQFIESLILGLPIPQIVLAERKQRKGTFIVIDGKQRLLTLQQFCNDGAQNKPALKLTGLLIEKKLNNKTYEDMRSDAALCEQLDALHSQTIRTVVIKNWPNEDFLYTVFLRLNSNSVPLSPQELRKALHPGPFMDFVETTSSGSECLLDALDLQKPDFRMRDVEIAIRYYAFKNFARKYNGNLKLFLDDACKTLNNRWIKSESEIRRQFTDLEDAIKITKSIFKKNSFRKYANGRYENRFNRAVFDIFLYYFSMQPYRQFSGKADEIKAKYEKLCETDADFLRSLETSTKTTEGVKKRFEEWGRALSGILTIPFKSPF